MGPASGLRVRVQRFSHGKVGAMKQEPDAKQQPGQEEASEISENVLDELAAGTGSNGPVQPLSGNIFNNELG